MPDLEIVPGERIGAFVLGLAEDQFAFVCTSTEGYQAPESGLPLRRGFYAYDFGMFVKARCDEHG